METKYLSVIIIVAVFLFFIILFGILSWKYQIKHQPYRELRDDYFAKYHQLKDQEVSLKIINTNIDLPTDEHFYLIKDNLNFYQQDNNLKKANKKAELIREYELDYEFLEEKNNYSLNNRVARFYKENLTVDLLVTNKQIIFKNDGKITSIKWGQVLKVQPTLITIKKNTFLGIIIYTKEKLYRIKDDELNDVLILQTLHKASQEANND